jgi:DNA-binding IclR family transcriptional regulator
MRKLQTVQVLDRAIRILDLLGAHDLAPLTLLSAEAELPLSTTSRIVKSLVLHGIVEQDPTTRSYRLGPRLLFLGSRVNNPRLLDVARPILERLSIESQEDAGISVLQGTHAIILDRVEGPHPLKIVEAMRQPIPLYCGAFRKVLLAYQPSPWIDEYIQSTKLIRFTARTIVSKGSLRHELQTIRERGYASSYGEFLADSAGVAAPVFGPRDEIQAALFIWGPYSRMNEKAETRLANIMIHAAAEVTKLGRGELALAGFDRRPSRRH